MSAAGVTERGARAQGFDAPAPPEEHDEEHPETDGLRFDDPYWDDAFCAWWDPTLRTCCD